MSKTPRKAADQASPLTAARPQEGTIYYEPTLIMDLTSQHTKILNNLKVIEVYARSGAYGKIHKALESFRRQLHAHLLQENLLLYNYLALSLRETFDDNRRQTATEMFNEMSAISRTVIEFLNYYSEHSVAKGNLAEFCTELNGICNSLQDRMFREEMTLFKLYVPPTG
jgi:regulator of sigma D